MKKKKENSALVIDNAFFQKRCATVDLTKVTNANSSSIEKRLAVQGLFTGIRSYNSPITCTCSSNPADTWRLYNVASTSMQRLDVASTLRRRCINVTCPLECYSAFDIFQKVFFCFLAWRFTLKKWICKVLSWFNAKPELKSLERIWYFEVRGVMLSFE